MQSVDSSLSRRGFGMSKKDTVCQVGKRPILYLEKIAILSIIYLPPVGEGSFYLTYITVKLQI